ncbi:hypothetical protein HRbin22_02127 [Candidatus Thermoflexus japonica]|uniref:Glycosyltransferase RgtA/B/C/D-like domain-containing protein n=1 Tax=Candidatus Thermoflexus japonica TaxID=2035417 RepID=A0A2H5Y8T6_9CHLR|nr:hypothetical protein HRbin22_02127 [Candidatus Thermoflexus japonica]
MSLSTWKQATAFRRIVWEGIAISGLSLPFLIVGAASLSSGFLSHEHAHLIEKALLVRDRGRLEWIGFAYPPLPVLTLLPWPTPLAAMILASVSGGLLAWNVGRRLQFLAFPPWIRAGLLLSFVGMPTILFLATQRFGTTLALVLFLWAWQAYLAFTRHGRTDAGFLAGLIIGFAFYASFYAPAFALAFALAAPLFAHTRDPRHTLAILMVLAFPTAMTIGAWIYLSWLFTEQPLAFLYDPGSSMLIAFRPDEAFITPEAMAHELVQRLLNTPLYLGVGVLIARLQPRRLPAYLIPLLLMVGAWSMGGVFPRELSVALGALFALSGIPVRTPPRWGILVLILALLQLGADGFFIHYGERERWWAALWAEKPSTADTVEEEIAGRLARLPCGSVLADDRQAYRLIARAGTACPFVLPPDPIFQVAVSRPERFVRWIIVAESPRGPIGPLEARYRLRAPPGFVLEASWPGWYLYRRGEP